MLGFLVGGSGGGGEEPAADTGALTGSAASSGAAVKVPGGLERARAPRPTCPASRCRTRRPPRPAARTAARPSSSARSKKAADNSTLLAQPFLQARRRACRSPAARCRSAAATCRPTATTRSSSNGFDRAVTVYAAPTTAGVATVACLAPAGRRRLVRLDLRPDRQHARAQLGRPAARRPEQGLRGRRRARRSAALNKADKSGQAKLKSAKTPQAAGGGGDARWPRRSTGPARRSPRQDLSPADRGVNGLLVKALRQTGGGYDKAASAAAKKSKSAFSKAGGDVAEGRKAIASALDGLKAAGYDVAS